MNRIPDHRVRALGHIAEKLAKLDRNEAARRLQAEINRLRQGVEALDTVFASRNPVETEAAHTKKVATMARKLDQEVTAAINRAGMILKEGSHNLQRRIDERVNLKPDAFAAEIRATFRAMSRKDQLKLMGELVRENRGPELAAIVKAPSILTGLSADEQARFEQAILGMHAPDEMAEMADLNEAFEVSLTATRVAGTFANSLTSPGKVAAIEKGEAASEAALSAFDQALQ